MCNLFLGGKRLSYLWARFEEKVMQVRLIGPTIVTLILSINLSNAVTVLSPPVFTPAHNAPLAGLLTLTSDVPSRVSVSMTDGTRSWQKNFYDFGRTHSLPLLGFMPNRTNLITVTVRDKRQNAHTVSPDLVFVTPHLPADFPTSILLTNQPEKMEPGYTLFRVQNRNTYRAYIIIVDNFGQVVWYSAVSTSADVRQLENGDLFIPLATGFFEVNMLGETVRTWRAPTGYSVNIHDGVPTDHGTILYLSDAGRLITDFPTSATNPDAPLQTAKIMYNRVVEIAQTNAALLQTWSPIDFLDPRRLTYATFEFNSSLGWDIEHSNAVLEDPRDNSIMVSMREQNAVIKFSRATGQLKWILGPHERWGPQFQQYLLTPAGTPFEWNYAQHAPMLTPQGTLLMYDNGNYRAMPFDPPVPDSQTYSRAVEYSIDETNMTVSQVWEYRNINAERLFSPIIGDADWLTNTGNILITFGYISYVNGVHPSPYASDATMVRIKEVTHDPVPEVVFDLEFFDPRNTASKYKGYFCYRADRITDLYSHMPQPVGGLTIHYQDGVPVLQFSADETRSYIVQASPDMVNWEEIGTASSGVEPGDFEFRDSQPGEGSTRYYRVITE